MTRKELNYAEVYERVVTDLVDYVQKYNIKALVLGISGGIDSTVCAAICNEVHERIGIKNVGISMPLKNQPDEVSTANLVGKAWYKGDNQKPDNNSYYNVIPISSVYNSFQKLIWWNNPFSTHLISIDLPDQEGWSFEELNLHCENQNPLINGNIMARTRMILLYNIAGREKGIVMDTDNLTEHWLGFFTIHGDQGDYKPIGQLWKMEVYGLAQWILENKADTPEKKKSLEKSIALIPTDGNGVSKGDLEQIGGESYDQVDRVLRNVINKETNDLSDIPEETQKRILARMEGSWFKR